MSGPDSARPDLERRARRVVLVGFMAAGKTSVGAALARRLGWMFVDVDADVERAAGASIPEIFRREGEATFRRLEAAATEDALRSDAVVIASGGGWPSNPFADWPELPPGTVSVWLRVGGREAVRRARAQGLVDRPLLVGDDPAAAAEELLAARDAAYRQAAIHVDTGGRGPEEIAAELARAVRTAGGRARDPSSGTNDA
ncbi:MAG TPA: shikimate kinase [Longimicrobiales bacterium]|nr:shikimate kinase [Longimicrobiales bacterium]